MSAPGRQPLRRREVLTNENANLEVERTGSSKPYNFSLSTYAASKASKAHQLKIAAQDAAAALESAQPEPGAVMSLNNFRRLRNLRSVVNESKSRANLAGNNALKNAERARIAAERRLMREKENPELKNIRLKQLIENSRASMKEEVRAKEEAARIRAEAVRVQAEEARRARYANYEASQRAAANARIAAAGQEARAREEAAIAQEAARRIRKGGKSSYRKKRTIRSKKYMNYKRKTHYKRK